MKILFILSQVWLICKLQLAEEECTRQSNWGPWRCPGEGRVCSGKTAKRYKCPEGDCTSLSQCTSLKGFQESKPCKLALSLMECLPAWSTWTSWTSCSATCGIAERSRYRACTGAWNITSDPKTPKLASCADRSRATEGFQNQDCPFRRLCPRIVGGWGEWGSYSECSSTCGKGFRNRIRLCNRPTPQGGGLSCQGVDTQQTECDVGVACPQNGQWCSWATSVEQCSSPCGDSGMGLRIRKCSCPKAANGGSGCVAPPGTKEVARLALLQLQQTSSNQNDTVEISSPSATAILAIADGSGRWDPCNRIYCPYLKTLTDSEQKIISQDLRSQLPEATWSWSGGIPARQFDPVGLHCPASLKSRVTIFDKKHRFPRGNAYWTVSIGKSERMDFNFPGVPLVDSKQVQVSGDRLVLRSLNVNDEGVYRYGYEYEPKKFATICFFVVYIADKEREVVVGEPYTLSCNAKGLWPIVQQTRNDTWTIFWNYEPDAIAISRGSVKFEKMWITTLGVPLTPEEEKSMADSSKVTSDSPVKMTLFDTESRRLDAVKNSMNGYYTCIVVNYRRNMSERRFITNTVYLNVIPQQALGHLFIKWITENGFSILVLVITTVVVVATYSILVIIRARRIASLKSLEMEEAEKRHRINLAAVDA